jgi:hypothetical protein
MNMTEHEMFRDSRYVFVIASSTSRRSELEIHKDEKQIKYLSENDHAYKQFYARLGSKDNELQYQIQSTKLALL